MSSGVNDCPFLSSPQLTTMSAGNEARAITVWQYLEWRCEYWQGKGASELRLYKAEQLVQLAHPLDTFETLERSASWHNDVPIPEIEIRSGPPRRPPGRTTRRGSFRVNRSCQRLHEHAAAFI